MALTGKARKDFIKDQKWWFPLLPAYIKNLLIIRWFDQNGVHVDIQYWWEDGYDYGVHHPVLDKVFVSDRHAGSREKDFDINIKNAINRANAVYNFCKRD